MPDQTPACDLSGIREAVCIHTKKVTDACRDKDCIEDLRVYLTRDSQAILDRCANARARCVELIHTVPPPSMVWPFSPNVLCSLAVTVLPRSSPTTDAAARGVPALPCRTQWWKS